MPDFASAPVRWTRLPERSVRCGRTRGPLTRRRSARSTSQARCCENRATEWLHVLRAQRLPLWRFQAGAHQFLVIPREDVFVSESGVRPANAIAFRQLPCSGPKELGAADLFEPFRRQASNEKLSSLVEHPDPVAVPDKMDLPPAAAGHRSSPPQDSV